MPSATSFATRRLSLATSTALPALLVLLSLMPACTTFATVRSARVQPANTFNLQASYASSPGDAAGWLLGNNFDCASRCRGAILGGDIGLTHGFVRDSVRPFALGIGLSGIRPYVDGYVQLGRSTRPYGVGARVAVPIANQVMGQVYGRYDVISTPGGRVLWNPAVLYASGTTVSSYAQVLALVNGFGFESSGDGARMTPSITFVLAQARHELGTVFREGPSVAGFVVAGLNFRLR